MIETLVLWLPTLVISLVAVGAFLYLAYQSRLQIDKLQKTIRQNSEQLVENFLQRESRSTLHRIQAYGSSEPTDTTLRFAQMRRCWLEAELGALTDHGQHLSDYELLQTSTTPLLKIAQRSDSRANPAIEKKWSSDESKSHLQRTRDAISSQKKFIQEFRTRSASLGSKVATASHESVSVDIQPENTADFLASMGDIETNTAKLLETINKLEQELAVAQTKYDIIKDKLGALEAIKITRQVGEHLTISRDTNSNSKDEDNGLLDDMESAHANSITEMKKMGGINRQQRQLILRMEKELTLLRKDSAEHEAASDVLNKLKLQLRDHENCTTILEMESETLREQIQNLRLSVTKNDPSSNSMALIHTGKAGGNIELTSSRVDDGVMELVENISAADNLENAGTQLVNWLAKQDIASVLFIKGNREQIWISSEGRVDDHSKQLLKSMMPIVGQPISEVREGVMFIYSVCRILLYGKGDFHERGSFAQTRLRDTFATAELIFKLLQDRIELRQHYRQTEKIQQKMQSLLVQYNYIDSEHMRTGANLRKELQEYLLTADTSEAQRSCVDTSLDDFDSQLEILSRTGKLVANGLKVSIQDLAKIEESPSA